jgi:hypothetical protein
VFSATALPPSSSASTFNRISASSSARQTRDTVPSHVLSLLILAYTTALMMLN